MPEKTPGKICWNELITSDPDAAKEFYGELFGWSATDMDMGGGMTYSMFNVPGAPEGPDGMAGGLLKAPMPGMPPHWLSYIMVEDVEATLAKAESLGAIVVKGITELPMGTFAIFTDPQGAAFAIWKEKCSE